MQLSFRRMILQGMHSPHTMEITKAHENTANALLSLFSAYFASFIYTDFQYLGNIQFTSQSLYKQSAIIDTTF